MRYLLCILLALGGGSAAGAGDRIELAQTVHPTVVPPPQLLPQTATSTTCIINCDTSAMIVRATAAERKAKTLSIRTQKEKRFAMSSDCFG